jgi:hypothetical protein
MGQGAGSRDGAGRFQATGQLQVTGQLHFQLVHGPTDVRADALQGVYLLAPAAVPRAVAVQVEIAKEQSL